MERKPILRFKFIIIFAVLFLVAMFILYMVQTKLEDVIEDEKPAVSTTVEDDGQTTSTTPPSANKETEITTTLDENIVTLAPPQMPVN